MLLGSVRNLPLHYVWTISFAKSIFMQGCHLTARPEQKQASYKLHE